MLKCYSKKKAIKKNSHKVDFFVLCALRQSRAQARTNVGTKQNKHLLSLSLRHTAVHRP